MTCVYPEPPNRRLLATRRSGRNISELNAPNKDIRPSADPISVADTSDSNVEEMPFAELLSPAGVAPFPLSSEFLHIWVHPYVMAGTQT